MEKNTQISIVGQQTIEFKKKKMNKRFDQILHQRKHTNKPMKTCKCDQSAGKSRLKSP